MQPVVYPGQGRLHVPVTCDGAALESMRVALSFIMLHQKGEWWPVHGVLCVFEREGWVWMSVWLVR